MVLLLILLLRKKENGKYIGECSIRSYDSKNRKVTIGLWLGEKISWKRLWQRYS